MRALVGVTDIALFDNPSGANALPEAGERPFGAVPDFGCGCGRLARKLIQQDPQPKRYVGIDLHAGMIRWCHEHLAPLAPQFSFVHHDVFNPGFNPGAAPRALDFPVESAAFDVVVAHSVFTHVLEDAAVHYLGECARALRDDGLLVSTWFLFDKALFPMMHSFQNALYINLGDPSNAVIYDRAWLRAAAAEAGLVITSAWPPAIRGFHWQICFSPVAAGVPEIELPADEAPLGSMPPPVISVPPHTIGA
jgi:SAM-dependent methyltransferase